MKTLSAAAWTLLALLSLLAVKGLGQDLDLSHAFDDLSPSPTPKPKPKEPAGGAGTGGDLDLSDVLDDKPPPKTPVQPKVPVRPKPEETHSNFFAPTVRPALLPRTTIRPLRTSAPPRKVQDDFEDLDLIAALDPSNDIGGKGKDPSKGRDTDLLDILTSGGEGEGGAKPTVSGVSTANGCEDTSTASCASVTEEHECEHQKNTVDEIISVKNELKNIGSVLQEISLSLKELVKK